MIFLITNTIKSTAQLDLLLGMNAAGRAGLIMTNDGTGRFTARQSLGGLLAQSVMLADFDGDGTLDAFLGCGMVPNGPASQVWLNDGHGTFRDSGARLVNAITQHAAFGDLNADGKLDLVVANTMYQADGTGNYVASASPVQVWLNATASYLRLNTRAPGRIAFESWRGGAFWAQYSGDLLHWYPLARLTNLTGTLEYLDGDAANHASRFYRAVISPNPDPARYVWIAPGAFFMGSPATEQDRNPDEGPQRQVTISAGFWMSRHEVTQSEYQTLMGNNPSAFAGDTNRPVEQTSWHDATNYCGALTQQERAAGRLPSGMAYRLPTEAEWEYACRGGTAARLYYGNDPGYAQLGKYAWYDANGGDATHPAGQKLPNAWGLYDMAGNVWEWCADWYGPYPGGAVTDPRGPVSSSNGRVIRGGSWFFGGWSCRSALRHYGAPENRINQIGFRIVLASDQ